MDKRSTLRTEERPWRPILSRLRHSDIWGPGGLVPLEGFRRVGRSYQARCPGGTHPDRHPSFWMPDGTSYGRCFACSYRSGWIDFVSERFGLGFKDAVTLLADRAGLPRPNWGHLPKPEHPDAFEVATRWCKQRLLDDALVAARCRDYLARRKVLSEVLEDLPVGCLPDPAQAVQALRAAGCERAEISQTGLGGRYLSRVPLLFVYTDGERVTGFKGRAPDPARKRVLNARGFGGEREERSPYCADLAREAIRSSGRAIVVEGEFDVLTWQAWFLRRGQTVELVALGGTAKPALRTFRRLGELGAKTVSIAFDADPAGRLATAAAIPLAWQAGLEPVVLAMPEGQKDPDEVFTTLGPEAGLAAFNTREALCEAAEWLADHWLNRWPPHSPERAARVLQEARKAAEWAPPAARERLSDRLARALGMSHQPVTDDLIRAHEEARQRWAVSEFEAWTREVGTLRPDRLPHALARGQAVLEAMQAHRAVGDGV